MNDSVNESDILSEDVFKILIATDIHLGYGEKDPIREKDTFVTFEEILKLAVDNEVDFMLLGGDLFHDSKPSSYTMFKCMELLNKYCLGDKPIVFEYLSDDKEDFKHLENPGVNYMDRNLNIGLPIFSIHGNHDDPVGSKHTSAMDILASSRLINYFGVYNETKQIVIKPICLKKGQTKLSLYGLSHIRDERLGRMFRNKEVSMCRPQNDEDSFNLLVLHQNRVIRGPKNFIPVTLLPDFLNLVVWGHEHDCVITPEDNGGMFITQPGSPVATSLSKGEAIPKHVGLLYIYKDKFKLDPIPLKTVRPFIYEDFFLEELDSDEEDDYSYRQLNEGDARKRREEKFAEKIRRKVDELIEKANAMSQMNEPMIPLIRLNLCYSKDSISVNMIRLGQEYLGKVANPLDMLHHKKINNKNMYSKNKFFDNDEDELRMDDMRINDLIDEYLLKQEKAGKEPLMVLNNKLMHATIDEIITKNDSSALKVMVEHCMDKMKERLREHRFDIDKDSSELDLDINIEIERIASQRKEEDLENDAKILTDPRRKRILDGDNDVTDDNLNAAMNTSNDDDSNCFASISNSKVNQKPARGRGSRGPRRPRGTTTTRGRSKKTTLESLDIGQSSSNRGETTTPIIIDSSDDDDSPLKKTNRRGTRITKIRRSYV